MEKFDVLVLHGKSMNRGYGPKTQKEKFEVLELQYSFSPDDILVMGDIELHICDVCDAEETKFLLITMGRMTCFSS